MMLLSFQSKAQLYFKSVQQSSYGFTSNVLPLKDSNEVHSPKKAAIMSAVIPGLGQIYNEKYWKAGLLYAAIGGMGYGLKWNIDRYKIYQQAYLSRIDNDSTNDALYFPGISDGKLKSDRNYYRENRDRLILGLGVLYALQIIDAHVDAHLREFDINEDLAFKPAIGFQTFQNQSYTTVGVRLRFR